MENTVYSDEIQHHGTKGMKWGRRLYQNKDGSLTPLGQKRYNKEVDKLKKETAKVKEAEKVAANKKKTQAKFDKLDAKKQALEERKKALKGDDADKKKDDRPEETVEQRRERLLKSTNPKELYEGKGDLSYQELSDRINRIDLESKLQSRIPTEENKTAVDWMDAARKTVDSASALYKSVDSAYSTLTNSTILKAMGLDLPTGEKKDKVFNMEEFLAKARANKLTAKEIQEGANAIKNINTSEQQSKQINNRRNEGKEAEQARPKKEADTKAKAKTKADAEGQEKQERGKKTADSKKQADDHNERGQKGETDDRYEATGKDVSGKGTSRYTEKSNDTVIDVEEGVDYRYVNPKTASTPMSNLPSTTVYSTGRSSVAGLLGMSSKSDDSSSSSSSRTSQSDDYAERIRKAAENLSKAASDSTDAVNKASSGEDIVQDLLKRNDDLLNGRK